jgi:hypothetical protein
MPPRRRGPAVRHFATAEKNSKDFGVCEVGASRPYPNVLALENQPKNNVEDFMKKW